MIKAALVLEGGALRGMYTSGVLDTFLKNNMEFECVAGVSAGALNAMSYISKQPGRSAKINLEYCDDPRYIGRKAFIKNNGIIYLVIYQKIRFHLTINLLKIRTKDL